MVCTLMICLNRRMDYFLLEMPSYVTNFENKLAVSQIRDGYGWQFQHEYYWKSNEEILESCVCLARGGGGVFNYKYK